MTVVMAIIKLLCTAPLYLLQFIKTSPNINQTDFYFYSIATRFPGLLMVQLYFGKHELSTFNLCW